MKVLQLGKFYPPSFGGIETVLRSLSEGLARSGDTVTVLCSADGPRRAEEIARGVRVVRAPCYARVLSQPISPALPSLTLSLAADADIVHVHSPNPLAESAALLLSADKPIIVSYHSDVVRQKALLPLYGLFLRKVLSRARRILVATPSHVECSKYLLEFRSKCEVIPFGLDPEEFRSSPAQRKAAEGLRERHGRFVLFVGRLVAYKGVEFLIRAAQGLSANVVVAGDGPLRSELETLATRTAPGRVRFLGSVDDETLGALYQACEMLVLPSVSPNEAFGLVQLEAMGWGKPSVVSRLPTGITEVNEDGKTGVFVPPRDPDALRASIERLLSDEAERRAMGERARARFESRFTSKRMVESVRAVYRQCRENAPPRPC